MRKPSEKEIAKWERKLADAGLPVRQGRAMRNGQGKGKATIRSILNPCPNCNSTYNTIGRGKRVCLMCHTVYNYSTRKNIQKAME